MREYHWSPSTIGDLFFDDDDYEGIVWIYNDMVEVQKEIERKSKK